MADTLTELPAGIVTFIFTDIEGSTRLLRRLGDDYRAVLDRHREILRTAFHRHDGHEVDAAGDSLFVAFSDATGALQACAAAQRALASEPWPDGIGVRVRMGVHTGLASPRGRDYVALAVHQAARVMSAAHGGQVLVSVDTVRRVSKLDRVDIVAVGRFRVRDFDDDLQLFTLRGDGLLVDLPAPRALPAEGHNLVRPPTSFIGRDEALERIVELVEPGRVVTVIGPGGAGKTRLAIEAGLRLAATWRDGVWLVDLAPLHDPTHVGPAIASAIGAARSSDDVWADIVGHLRERHAVIVLDNCEHLVEACADASQRITTACVGCCVLATSRASLGARGEVTWRLEPLASAAVTLFLDRARLVRPDLAVDDDALGVIDEICRRVDGLPLAVELAAARIAVLSPADVLEGLGDRFRLLRSTRPDVPARQRTLDALLDWSERLLGDDERTCLRRLSLFAGAFSMPAAAAAAAHESVGADDVADLVWSLVDKSLVVADLRANGTRYRLLESVRDYGRRRLDEEGERASVATRLADWYLDRIGPSRRHLQGWVGETADEIDNLRALVTILGESQQERAQEIAFTIGCLHDAVHSYRDGVSEVTQFVTTLTGVTPVRVSLLTTLADLLLRIGDIDGASSAAADASALAERVGVPSWDDVAVDRTTCEIASRRGEHDAALARAGQALARDLSLRGRGRMWSQLGIAAMCLDDLETAWRAFTEERGVYATSGEESYLASAEGNLAEVALRRGDTAGAARHQQACLDLALELGASTMAAFSFIVAARIAAGASEWETAVALHAAADRVLDETGFVLYDADRLVSDAMLSDGRDALGDSGFDHATASGGGLDIPTAAAIASVVLTKAAALS